MATFNGVYPEFTGVTIGSKISERRMQLGMSQTELAFRVSISPTSISRIENKGSIPRPGTLLKIAEVLKTTVSELTGKPGSKPVASLTLEEIVDELRRRNIEATFVFK